MAILISFNKQDKNSEFIKPLMYNSNLNFNINFNNLFCLPSPDENGETTLDAMIMDG